MNVIKKEPSRLEHLESNRDASLPKALGDVYTQAIPSLHIRCIGLRRLRACLWLGQPGDVKNHPFWVIENFEPGPFLARIWL